MKKNYSLFLVMLMLAFFTGSAFSQNIPVKITPIGLGSTQKFSPNTNNGSILDAMNVTVLPANGSTSGNGRAPQGSRRFINSKYIISANEITTSGFGANALTSIGWTWNVASGVAQSVGTTGRLKVYVKDTSATAVTMGSTFVDTNGTGFTKIIEGTISIPAQSTAFYIDVPVGGTGTSTFTPTPGNALLIIFVYTTLDPTLATGNPSVYCTTALEGNVMATYQSQTVNDQTGTTTTFRPETRFGNNILDVVQVTETYTLGKVPNIFGVPYNISTLVRNNDTSPVTFDVVVTIKDSATGTVRYTRTDNVAGLGSGLSQEIFYTDYVPIGTENDSVIVEIVAQPGETVLANNRSAKISRITANSYSYAQSNTPAGGIGFNGNTGDFVARFRTNSSNSINQIDVNFTSGGKPFRVGIWSASAPGSPPLDTLWQSASLTSAAGVYTILVNPPVAVSGDFFVGVRQTDTVNVRFSYQSETPIRDSSFYYASPTGSTTWYDFAPASAFRFMIEPKFALNNDVGASAVNQSGTTYFASGTTAIPMTGSVTNYGLSMNSFNVVRKIYDNTSALVYSNSVSVSNLASNGTAVTTFPDFTGFVSGTAYTIADSTELGGDQSNSNDKLTRSFTPVIAKTLCLLYTDAASRDSLTNQLNNGGYTGMFDVVDGATFTNSFRAWRSVYYLLASSGTWTAVVRDSLKAFLDNSTAPNKKSLAIFGNDLGYNNDPIRNAAATAADTLFYRQYLRAQYVADSWLTGVPTADGKIYGAPGSPFSSITGDSVADPFPDMVMPATWYGGGAAFLPLTTTTGDSSAGVYYIGANYNVFYGTNVYANYRTKSSTLDSPIEIFDVIAAFVNNNGGLVPVDLASFTANTVRNEVNLSWRTVSELNNSGFDIERAVNGTTNWSKVGFVSGNGTTNSEMSYTFKDAGLAKGTYGYRLKQIDYNGNYKYYQLAGLVNVGVPNKFDLSQNYPNPFNPATKISYDIPFDSKIAIKIFDVTGREVASLVNQIQMAGYYVVDFNASSLSSGVYFYNIIAEGGNNKFVMTKKMVLVK